jgi:hypothetical protein
LEAVPERALRKFQLLDLLKFDRSVWLFLLIGIAVRCVALNHPLVDAHLIRQCQTAAATKSLMAEPGFHVSSKIPWLGDLDAHYVLELPIYNYLVIGVHFLTRNLDLSGKLTTILLWAASFICLQFIWRRILDSQQAFWANLLFVVAPLSVFYGQAFMPEMLVQLLAFGFVLLVLRYDESPTLLRWSICAAVGLMGLVVKLPETAHLYLILAFLLWRREGWKGLLRPRYLIAAVLTLAAIKGWSAYTDTVNTSPLSFGSSKDNLRVFIGTLESRFQLKPWTMVLLYLGAFVVPGPLAIVTCYGLLVFLRKYRRQILGLWLLSLAAFYLLWFGNTAAGQNYYNLPALAPLCALFGIGANAVLGWNKIVRWRFAASVVTASVVMISAVPALIYLFKQDRPILEAARWTRAHTGSNETILFRPNHRWDMIDYPFNAVLAYYSDRPTFVWTRNTPDQYRQAALQRASYAIVTLPQPPAGGILGVVNRFRHAHDRQPESVDWLESAGFEKVAMEEGFVAYRRK